MAYDEFIIGKKMKFYKYIHTQTSKPKKDNVYRWDMCERSEEFAT